MSKTRCIQFCWRKPETVIWVTQTEHMGMWACSPPAWFIPAHRLLDLQSIGLDVTKPGMYVMRADKPNSRYATIEFVREAKSNLKTLMDDLAFYSDEVKLWGIPTEGYGRVTAFLPGKLLALSHRLEFVSLGQNSITYRYSLNHGKMGIYAGSHLIGIIHAQYPEKYPHGRCDICGLAATTSSFNCATREAKRACPDHAGEVMPRTMGSPAPPPLTRQNP